MSNTYYVKLYLTAAMLGRPEAKQGRTYANFVCVRPAALKTNPKGNPDPVAIYHLSVKTISRAAGRSATAAAAYRAGAEIVDKRTGEIHDYTRKRGVESATVLLPDGSPEWAADRAALWNAAEQAETRKNSTVAREFEIALPSELSPKERERLAHDFAREIVARHGCAADVAIHQPSKDGDARNHHAHILCTTRRLMPEGFGEKTRELDDRKTGEIDRWRERFAVIQNEHFLAAGMEVRVDHRSLEAQGIEDRAPTMHLGPIASAIERRESGTSRIKQLIDVQLQAARELGQKIKDTIKQITEVSTDLAVDVSNRNKQLWQQLLYERQERDRRERIEHKRVEEQQRIEKEENLKRLENLQKLIDRLDSHPKKDETTIQELSMPSYFSESLDETDEISPLARLEKEYADRHPLQMEQDTQNAKWRRPQSFEQSNQVRRARNISEQDQKWSERNDMERKKP